MRYVLLSTVAGVCKSLTGCHPLRKAITFEATLLVSHVAATASVGLGHSVKVVLTGSAVLTRWSLICADIVTFL